MNFAALRTVKDDPHGEVFAELRKVMLRASGHEQQIPWAAWIFLAVMKER